uniref:E3 ubiquitin-protein ligase n=1 Tax=Caenorhabditis tropicalis TaxID=1561998 RepID=A0A1I7TCG8_9PELO
MAKATKRKNKKSKVKKVKDPKTAMKNEEKNYVWIYGEMIREGAFEFHPDVQEFIETCWSRGKKICRIMVFGMKYLVNFCTMTVQRTEPGYSPNVKEIKRLARSTYNTLRKKNRLCGVAGGFYPRKQKGSSKLKMCVTFASIRQRCQLEMNVVAIVFVFLALEVTITWDWNVQIVEH